MVHMVGMIAAGPYNRVSLESRIQLQEEAAERVPKAPALDPIEASDREDAISDWLDDRGVADGWNLAPAFVQAGLDIGWLAHVAAAVDEGALGGGPRRLTHTAVPMALISEVPVSTTLRSHLG